MSKVQIHISLDFWKKCSEKLEKTPEEIIEAFKSVVDFHIISTSVSSSVAPKQEKTKTTSSAPESGICERIPRGKDKPCGKRAKNLVTDEDGTMHWFCGSEKSGCYKAAKKKVEPASRKAPAKRSQPATKKPSEAAKNLTILDKIVSKKDFTLSKIQVDGKLLHINPDNRVLFNPEDGTVYGLLSDKNKIQPLSEKEKRWIDANGLSISPDPVKPKEVVEEEVEIEEETEEGEEETEEIEEEETEDADDIEDEEED